MLGLPFEAMKNLFQNIIIIGLKVLKYYFMVIYYLLKVIMIITI
jgi:hypothetical protein